MHDVIALQSMALVAGAFLIIWVLEGMLNWAITGRIIRDPVTAKAGFDCVGVLACERAVMVEPALTARRHSSRYSSSAGCVGGNPQRNEKAQDAE